MPERREFLDYTPSHIPLSILSEDYQPPEPEGEQPSLSEMWEAAKYRNWVGESLSRHYEAEKEGGVQQDYKVDRAELMKYNKEGYTEQEIEFLAGAVSPENFAHRQSRIKADREVKQVLENGGVTGYAIETASAIFDPAMVPLMFVDAPAALTNKVGRIGSIGWSMLRGGSEGVLSEYLLKMGDTQRTEEDLYMSAIGGVAFSGAIDATKLGYKAARNALDRTNAVESIQRAEIKTQENVKGYHMADEALASQQPDPVARKRYLTERDVIDELRKEAGERVDVLSQKKVKKLRDEFREFRKSRLEIIEKIKARPNLRPSARAAEIQQVEGAIARREAELNDAIEANRIAMATNSKIDALQQGKVPESLMQRYRELKAERGEFDVEPSKSLGKDIKAGRKPVVDETGKEEPPSQSVGAMRARQEFDDIQTYDELLTPTDVEEIQNALSDAEAFAAKVPRNTRFETSAIGKPLRSLSSEIDTAPDDATRGLGKFLVKDPQRTIEGHQSAEELAETLFNRAVPDYLDYQNAFDAFRKERGVGKFDIGKLNELQMEFDRQTVMKQATGTLLSNNPVEGDDAIILGAKARSRLYEQGLKNNKDYNVVGFDKIKHRHEYHSVVFNPTNIIANENHADFIYDCIASAYQTGGIKLSRENALRLAKNQVARAMSYGGKSHKTFDSFMSDAEFRKLEEELLANNIDKDVIDDIKQAMFDKEEMGQISPRAMFSLRPNLKARSGDVWMVDLIDTSIDRNMKYVSDSAANAGLASNGFHSRHQFQRAVAAARDAAINDIRLDVARLDGKAKAKAQEVLSDLENGRWSDKLDEALRLLYKEPLEDHDGMKDVTRMARKATSVVRLRSTGLMTIPEYSVAMLRNGIVNTLKQIPSSRWFDYRTRSVTKDKFMMDFARTFSATGHQEYLFGRKFYNGADFDDMTKNKLKRIDNMLGNALDITMTVNGFKMFQQGGEEMTARAIVNNLRDMAIKGEVTDNVRNSLIRVGGMSSEQVDAVMKHLRDNKDMDIFNAVRQLDADTYNSLSTAVRNTIGSSFLRLGIGEQPAYMNKELGKVMTTLLSFTIGSYEKMLLRGIKNERALLLSMGAGQAVLGYFALVANTYIQANQYSGRERDEYIRKHLEDEGLFWGVINRVGILAAPMLPLQMLNSLNFLPEDMRGAGNFSGIQSVEMAKDVAKATSAAMSLATEDKTNREEERSIKTIQRVLPWYNSTLWNLTFGVATE
ncbi:internal virion protein [Vibrio phage vB_ValA_R15Z]|uniref:Internal virion protein n=1 Tax=Vibrio phage vB_ValA_R15Z TaxID=3044218 RepID=A0AA49X682_9CAUD|nr:internal virion protein [Vibrio phage vB_ValA_R15Z]